MTTCNYIEYQRMTNSLFFGVALTDKHMNEATEHIERDGGVFEVTDITLNGNNSRFKYNRHL